MTEPPSRLPRSQVLLERAAVAYCAVLPLDIVPFAFGRSVTAPFLILLLVAWLRNAYITGQGITVHGGVLALFYLIFVWCIATLAWSASWPATLIASATLAVQLITVVALSQALPTCWRVCMRWLTHGTVVLAMWVLLSPISEDRQGRASVGGIDENVTGLVLTMGFAAGTYCLLMTDRRANAPLLVVELLLIVTATLRGGSRTAVVAIAATMVVASLLALRPSRSEGGLSVARGWLLMSAAGATYAFLVATRRVPERVITFVSEPTQANDSSRGDIIARYLRFQDEWMWRGVGYGADNSFLSSVGAGYENAHSMMWKTWIETGLIGLALFGSMVVLVLWFALRNSETRTPVLLLSVPIATYAITLGGDRITIFWFVVALACAGSAGQPARSAKVL